MKGQVTISSQQHRLRDEVQRSNIRHGETVRADIPRVRVGLGNVPASAVSTVFFCDIEPIQVRRRITTGDDAPLPEQVILEGIDFPGPGEYDLTDAIISTNGHLTIAADARTRVERHVAGQPSRLDQFVIPYIW